MRRIAIPGALLLAVACMAAQVFADDGSASKGSVSKGYYAGYSAMGYFPHYVAFPNYPPHYPPCLGYGFGIRGYPPFRVHYIHGVPAGGLPCPMIQKTGPVIYRSGYPVHGPVVYEGPREDHVIR